ncbi:MAG TPA: hypothetical protein PK836_06540 [Syntrophales bacterium]|nr:hypothetical protein [Syntrophales bacterium]HOM07288.1 hypothetical protein [Syntrophales bacterium]HOO00161.1 hypothetical protein [Syntrophales bacterium]HPC01330.1 hypothetical protein [Syntrophales bacterium]HPQ06867.1 hypothetical protein [Syntrophales bacterium]
MVRSRYTFEKRQRELAREQRKREKALRRAEAKQNRKDTPPEGDVPEVEEGTGNAEGRPLP